MENLKRVGGERNNSSLDYFKKQWQLCVGAIVVLAGFTIGYVSTNIEFPILSNFLPELIPEILLRNLLVASVIVVFGLAFSVVSIPFAFAQSVYSGVGMHIVHGHLIFETAGMWLALAASLRLTSFEIQYLRTSSFIINDNQKETKLRRVIFDKQLRRYIVFTIVVIIFGAWIEALYGV